MLRGRRVFTAGDNDDPGRSHVEQVARSLHDIAECVRIVELAGLPVKGDVSDWLAAVLHCVEYDPAEEIDLPTLLSAVEIARYLVPHAEAVLNMMQAQEGAGDEDARYVLRWIERHGRREFTKSEAQHQGKRRFPKADDIDPTLTELTRRGYIRLVPGESAGPGRPPSPKYEVNPAVFNSQKHKNRSHNSRNSITGSDGGNCGNNGSASGLSENENRQQVTI